MSEEIVKILREWPTGGALPEDPEEECERYMDEEGGEARGDIFGEDVDGAGW